MLQALIALALVVLAWLASPFMLLFLVSLPGPAPDQADKLEIRFGPWVRHFPL